MKKKVLRLILFLGITLVSIAAIVIGDNNCCTIVSTIGGVVAGLSIPKLGEYIVDLFDNRNWKSSLRKHERGKLIGKEDFIRISFAYLFRIKVDGKYFLVKNERGTGKYQPVGGVYKFTEDEKLVLRSKYCAEDDDKIPIDDSSRRDYRLRIKDKYIRSFYRHFKKGSGRENIGNLGREFREELIDTNILDPQIFADIKYRYIGRHITEVKYGDHFRCYEVLLADVCELELTSDQEIAIRDLMSTSSDLYLFASDSEINSLGVKAGSADLAEKIGDHTKKILVEAEDSLIKDHNVGKVYSCSI
ncbi:MAG: hypothetical protein Q4B26_10290 [Eubacteriales bacterium]|nr:hypothetical protein [Eubacteriales bacterium]